MILRILPFLILTFVSTSTLAAQSIYQEEARQMMWVEMSGEVKVRPVPILSIVLFPGQELLRSETVLRELEVVPDQKSDLAKLYKKIDRKRKELAKNRGQQLSDAQNSDLSKFRESTKQDIERILLPFQLKRFKEISQLVSLRQKGALQYAFDFSKRNKIPFVKSEFEVAVKKELKLANETSRKVAVQIIEQVLAQLTKDQRALLAKLIGESLIREQDLEFLVLDLTNVDRQEASSSNTIFDEMRSFGGFTSSLDGSWSRQSNNDFTDEFLTRQIALGISRKPNSYVDLKLSEAELDAVDRIVQSRSQALKELRNSWQISTDSIISKSELKIARNDYNDQHIEIAKKLVADFRKIVPLKDLEKLRDSFFKVSVVTNGVISELAASEQLQRHLSLSNVQIKNIRGMIPKLADSAVSQLKEIEINAWKNLLSEVSDELSSPILDGLGEAPKHIPPSYRLLLR